MHDQANDLRRLVSQSTPAVPGLEPPRPRLVVIAGGKGGVGATTVAVNLAVVLALQRHRTVLVDADPDGGNAAMLAGLEERYTIADVLSDRRTVQDALETGPGGVLVLPGSWGLASIAEHPAVAHERLVRQLQALGSKAEVVIVDAAAGSDRLTRRFWQAADAVLLVTSPEPASVMNAYASIKALAGGDDSIPIHSLVNMASRTDVAVEVHARLARACLRFLGIRLGGLGHLGDDPLVAAAGRGRKPFVLAVPGSQSTRQIHRLAEALRPRDGRQTRSSPHRRLAG